MFDLKRPCHNCPFRKGQGELYSLGAERCLEIFDATSFQCHQTVDYEHWDEPHGRQGKHPQQCAGVMSILHRANLPNQIMQIAERTGFADFSKLDHSQVYEGIGEALDAHSFGERWEGRLADRRPRLVAGQPTRALMPDFVRAWEFRRPRSDGPL
jgi:hypothetical protein